MVLYGHHSFILLVLLGVTYQHMLVFKSCVSCFISFVKSFGTPFQIENSADFFAFYSAYEASRRPLCGTPLQEHPPILRAKLDAQVTYIAGL